MNSLSIPVKKNEGKWTMNVHFQALINHIFKKNYKNFKGKMNIHLTFRQKSKTNTKHKNKPLFDNELFYSAND